MIPNDSSADFDAEPEVELNSEGNAEPDGEPDVELGTEAIAKKPSEKGQALAHPQEVNQVILRSRDVQALSRSFRKLADVQQGLLDQMADMETTHTQSWILPVVGVGSLALGVGLAIAGLGWFEQQKEPTMLPDVVVNPTPITIEAAEGALDKETVAALVAEMKSLREGQAIDRDWVTRLNEKLIKRDVDTLVVLERLVELQENPPVIQVAPVPVMAPQTASVKNEEWITPAANSVTSSAPGVTPVVQTEDPRALSYPADPWLGVLNGLLALDGYPYYRFQKATRVPGLPQLSDVTLLLWGKDGLLESVIKADRVEFNLLESAHSLTIRLYEGTRTHQGLNLPIPRTGSRVHLPDVNVPAWAKHFPALVPGSNTSPEIPGTVNVGQSSLDLKDIRQKMDELISTRRAFGFYRLTRLGGLRGDMLTDIQITWYDVSGRLVKTIEADRMEIKLHPQGWVELLLRDGAFLEGGMKRPFYEDKFRLHLPRQPLEKWHKLGIPVTTLDS